jgi:predicted lipoprotein with Yx(FWY)xxD motif
MQSIKNRRYIMKVTRLSIVAVLIAAAVALALFFTSSGSNTSSAHTRGGSSAMVGASNSSLGTILVDSGGRTLYMFGKDRNNMSACFDTCTSFWPPYIVKTKPQAGSGVSAAKLGTTSRGDGTIQATYNGHPLYAYIGDSAPGQTTGQGLFKFGAEWTVLSPAGNRIGGNNAATSGY